MTFSWFEIWDLGFQGWGLKIGVWRLGFGGWRLEVRVWVWGFGVGILGSVSMFLNLGRGSSVWIQDFGLTVSKKTCDTFRDSVLEFQGLDKGLGFGVQGSGIMVWGA